MEHPTYKYYLKKNATTWYYVDSDGSVKNTTEKTSIRRGVMNWREMELSWVRHERYHGMLRRQSTSLQFANELATVLRYAYFNQGGVMASVTFVLEVYNESTFDYSELFSCPVDFATFKSYEHYVECSLMEGGLSAIVAAYEGLEHEVSIATPSAVTVAMDGITIKTRYIYGMGSYSETVSQIQQNDIIRLTYVRQIGDFTVGSGNSPDFTAAPGSYFFETGHNIYEWILSYNFNISYTNNGANANRLKIRLEVWSGEPGTSTLVHNDNLWVDGSDLAPAASRTVSVSGTATYALVQGYKCVLNIDINSLTPATLDYTFNSGSVSVMCHTNSGVGTTTALRLPELLKKHLDAMAGTTYPLVSNFLWDSTLNTSLNYDARPFNLAITSEMALKGRSTPTTKNKLTDINQLLLSVFGAGIGTLGGSFRVEKLSYFYDKNTVIYDFEDNYKDLSFEQAGKYVITEGECGYEGYDAIDDENKSNEFNAKHVYKFPINRVLDKSSQTLNLVCPYPASMYYIELVRAQNLQNTIAVNNTKRDDSNKNFLIYLNTAGNGPDKSGTVTGIDFPNEAYNTRISPKRNFLRNGPLGKSICSMLQSKIVAFQTAEQTKDMSASLGAGLIYESNWVNFSTLPVDALFYPVIVKFKAPAPANLAQLMDSTPYGVMRIRYNDQNIDGFVLKATLNPGVQQVFEYELLLSPNTPLTMGS